LPTTIGYSNTFALLATASPGLAVTHSVSSPYTVRRSSGMEALNGLRRVVFLRMRPNIDDLTLNQ
jgi:hypothetical protein